MFDQKQLLQLAFILTVIGAINWGAQQMGQDLVIKTTSALGVPQYASYIYYAVGISGAVVAYQYFNNKIYISI